MSHKETAVIVRDLDKSFKLPHEQHSGIKQLLVNFAKRNKGYEIQHVLNNVSFEIKTGEFFGIVGRNGSGKSTLLKLLAGIYVPDRGGVQINGSLTPFIELGVGFNPELTGRENVFLNGALLGFSRREMDVMYTDIVSFAELDSFMDQKLKNYSSGMQVRLAFSIAIRAESDILLIDEVLAVGDSAFQQKCYEYFDELKRKKKTIILVSHDMGAIQQFCDRAVLISKGKVVDIGSPVDIAVQYERLNFAGGAKAADTKADVRLTTTLDDGVTTNNFEYGSNIIIEANWGTAYQATIAGFAILKDHQVVFATNTIGQDIGVSRGSVKMRLAGSLGNGRYEVHIGLFGKDRYDNLGAIGTHTFTVFNQPRHDKDGHEWEGIVHLKNKWLSDAG